MKPARQPARKSFAAFREINSALRDPALRNADTMSLELSTDDWRELIRIGKHYDLVCQALDQVRAAIEKAQS